MLRRLQLFLISAVLLVAAFSTGLPFLFYLVYLAILIVGGSYVLTRLGLSDLEAGYAVSQLHGHVGDRLKVTYTLRNTSPIPKFWLEIHNPTSLPGGLPGRALNLGPRAERSWLIRAPLVRRGHFRIEPIPMWRIPAANVEGSHAAPERTLQTTPLATTVRPWAPGDSMNRIHWKSTARQGEILVKEFDLETTADAWIVLDLQRDIQTGRGDESTVEASIRVAASIADKAVAENRSVGMTVNAHRLALLPADRGGRQHLKIMQLLAAVDGDGGTPLEEVLVATVSRLRRGMTAIVVTASLDTRWVRPLSAFRSRGIACVAVTVDADAFERHARDEDARLSGRPPYEADAATAEARAKRLRALRHALAEYELRTYTVVPGRPLGEVLVG